MHIIRIVIGTTCLMNLLGSSSDPTFYVLALSGDHQIGTAGQLLPEPLVARLTDEAGNGVMDETLVFHARQGGDLIDDSGKESTRLVLRTDSRGDAFVEVRLAPDADANHQIVRVSSAVADTSATFSFRGSHVTPAPEYSLVKLSEQEQNHVD